MEIIIKLEEKGYELTIYRDEDNYTGLNIKQSTAKYAPAIYHESSLDDFTILKEGRYSEIEFSIQTTSYGAKSVEEIGDVVTGYQDAIKAVQVFNIELMRFQLENK